MGVSPGETKAIRKTSRGHVFHPGIMPGALWRFAYLIFATAQGVWYGCSCFPAKETEARKVEDLVLGHAAGWQRWTSSLAHWLLAVMSVCSPEQDHTVGKPVFKLPRLQRLGTNDFKVDHLPSKTQLPSPTASWMFPVASHSKNCCSTCQLKQWSSLQNSGPSHPSHRCHVLFGGAVSFQPSQTRSYF